MKFPRILFLSGFFFGAAALFSRQAYAQEEAAVGQEEPKPKPKKKTKSKGYDYDKSKYKAFRVNPEPSVYRFDAKGNPILPGQQKSPAKKKPVSDPEGQDCRSEDACAAAEES